MVLWNKAPAAHWSEPGIYTRKEELMVDPETLQKVWALRNAMQNMEEVEGLKFLFSKMMKTKSNEEFLNMMNE